MVYANYEYYKVVFCGTAVPAERWGGVALRAAAYLDSATFYRLSRGEPVTEEVRMAVCAVAEVLDAQGQAASEQGRFLKSESTDGYRVDYENAAAVQAMEAVQLRTALDVFLPPCHPLRYAGVGG